MTSLHPHHVKAVLQRRLPTGRQLRLQRRASGLRVGANRGGGSIDHARYARLIVRGRSPTNPPAMGSIQGSTSTSIWGDCCEEISSLFRGR